MFDIRLNCIGITIRVWCWNSVHRCPLNLRRSYTVKRLHLQLQKATFDCFLTNFWATFWEIAGKFLENLEQLVESPSYHTIDIWRSWVRSSHVRVLFFFFFIFFAFALIVLFCFCFFRFHFFAFFCVHKCKDFYFSCHIHPACAVSKSWFEYSAWQRTVLKAACTRGRVKRTTILINFVQPPIIFCKKKQKKFRDLFSVPDTHLGIKKRRTHNIFFVVVVLV